MEPKTLEIWKYFALFIVHFSILSFVFSSILFPFFFAGNISHCSLFTFPFYRSFFHLSFFHFSLLSFFFFFFLSFSSRPSRRQIQIKNRRTVPVVRMTISFCEKKILGVSVDGG